MSTKPLALAGGDPPNQTPEDLIRLAIAEARRWLDASPKRSQGDVATGIGRSRALVNRFLSGNYADGDQISVARELLQFVERDERINLASIDLRPVETPTFKAVTVALEMAKYGRRMGIIYGAPGVGKTFAAEQFVARDPKGCLFIWLRYGLGTPKGFIAELLRLLEGTEEEIYRQPSRMARQAIAHLKKRPRFLVVNDGQILRFRVFEFLTALIEQCRIGVAVIGHECMQTTITSGRQFDHETYDRIVDFSSFTRVSHIGIEKVIKRVDTDEVGAVVRQILPSATEDAIRLFADVNVFPSMRSVVNVARDAKGLIGRKKGLCDSNLIAQALRLRQPESM